MCAYYTCFYSAWSKTFLIGWSTGAVDLYTLPDCDPVTHQSLQLLLQNPFHLVPAVVNGWHQAGFFAQNATQASAAALVGNRVGFKLGQLRSYQYM